MGFLKRFQKKTIFHRIDKHNWMDVFSYCLGKMIIIQQYASDHIVKGRNWNVDFSTKMISFGDDSYPVQLIGSESNQSNTWNWGWNNINHFDEDILVLANEMQELGEAWSLDALRIAQFKMNEIYHGHNLAIVACGLSQNDYFYYRGPHAGGAILMAIKYDAKLSINAKEFVSTMMQCIQNYQIEHKIFVEALLEWNHTSYTWKKNKLIAHFKHDVILTFEKAEDHYRIVEVSTKRLEGE